MTIVALMGVLLLAGLPIGIAPRPRSPELQVRSDTTVKTPSAGSPTRTAILDAVRAKVGVKSRFKVTHVRTTERWAFVRCTEVVEDGTQLQETDLDVAALLERRAGKWVVAELWSLSSNDERPYTPFARRVRQRARDAQLPPRLFPAGFLTSDVPVS